MPRYVIEREVPNAGSLTEDQLREMSLQSLEALNELGPKIQWIHSYVTDNKVYCVYVAADEEMIRQHGKLAGVPVSRIARVRHLIDPTNYASA
jgi:hypothetical protein